MYFFLRIIVTTLFILFFVTSLFNDVAAQDKPLLSEAIHNAIDTNGVEAAKQQFAKMNPSEREQYNVDTEDISELTNVKYHFSNLN